MDNDPISTIKSFQDALKKRVPNKTLSTQMTKAGADYMAQELSNATRAEHYDPKHKDTFKRKDGTVVTVSHLADSVTELEGTITGKQDGSYTVGYDTRGVDHGRIARFLNDGTVHIRPDYFVDRIHETAAAAGFQKMADVYYQSVNDKK